MSQGPSYDLERALVGSGRLELVEILGDQLLAEHVVIGMAADRAAGPKAANTPASTIDPSPISTASPVPNLRTNCSGEVADDSAMHRPYDASIAALR